MKLLDARAAATFLREQCGLPNMSPPYLGKLRTMGGGPAFQKFGTKVLYQPENLQAWATEKLGPLLHSSAEARGRPVRIVGRRKA